LTSIICVLNQKLGPKYYERSSFGSDTGYCYADNQSRILLVFVLANGVQEPIGIQESRAIAHNVDLLLGDPSGLAFFIHYLESCEQLNLIKFWIHVEGYKASFGEKRTVSSQKAEESLALLDARNIYNKYIDEESVSSISFPRKILKKVFDKLSEQQISSDIFDEARDYVHDLFDSRYFKQFEESLFYKKYQLQVLSRHCGLDDVLHVPSLLNAFLEFVDNRGDHNCLQFLIACHTFETNYRFLSDKEALDDAMSIYDKYISMQAISPLKIDDMVRRTMESEICTVSGRPSQMSFYSAKRVCALRIRERYLRRFVRSPGYHNYLIELEADVHNTVSGIYFQCRYSATNDEQSGYYPNDAERFNYDFCRNLAEVDCMGRYHVLYDDSLAVDKDRGPSRIRQKLRKYLDKATLKEEEVALEVARTIIADVQNMVEAGRK
uniref:RGS domain-containing protein n=1 Tax=Angiostrongylus costaricensis TaxID=334426 RepID=A0A0R3PU48_ANGCS